MKKKYKILIITLLLIVIIFIGNLPATNLVRSIDVNSDFYLEDYNLEIQVPNEWITSFNDVKFTDSNDTELSYDIYDINIDNYTNIWIKTNLTYNETVLYMYYDERTYFDLVFRYIYHIIYV